MAIALKKRDTSLIAESYGISGIIFSAMGNFTVSEIKMKKALQLYEIKKDTIKTLTTKANLYRLKRYKNRKSVNDTVISNIVSKLKLFHSHKYFKIKKDYLQYLFEDEKFPELVKNSSEWLQDFDDFKFNKNEEEYKKDYINNLKPACLALNAYGLIETKQYQKGNKILNQSQIKNYLNRKNNVDPLAQDKEISTFCFYKTKYFLSQQAKSDSLKYYLNSYNKYNNLFYTNFQDKFRTTTTNFVENQNKIKLLSIENQKNKDIAEKSKVITIITLLCVFILIILILILYRTFVFRKRNNIILENKNKELLSIDKERNRFFSVVTHELRTPIYSIKGLTHLLLEESKSDNNKVKGYLKSLNSLGELLYSLTNNLLLYAKFNLGESNVRRNETKLRQFINKTIQSIAFENEIIIEIDEDVWDYVIVDKIKLSQILINLVSNAMKFSNKEPIYLTIKNINQDENTCQLKFCVKDSGKGISIEKQKVIFEPFNKNEDNELDVAGTGLGLYIVKNVLKLYKSKIEIQSEIGKGSEFSFELILEKYLEPKEEKEFPLDGLKILVVDDNKLNLMITKKIVENANAFCETIDNGYGAINLTKNKQFDLILMDVHMPNIDGLEATRQIRKFNKNIPIIALTAVDFETNQQAILESGMNDIISKPFNNNYLYERINYYCE
jgi:signal transduction histidine kinase/CheY-like chemotaxis protein